MFPEYRWLVQMMLEIRVEYIILVITKRLVQMGLLVKSNVQILAGARSWETKNIYIYVAASIVS